MGRGIALAYAFAGVPVVMVDLKQRTEVQREQLHQTIQHELNLDLDFLTDSGLLKASQQQTVRDLVRCVDADDTAAALKDCDLVYEAVPEVLDAKRDALNFAGKTLQKGTVHSIDDFNLSGHGAGPVRGASAALYECPLAKPSPPYALG